MKWKLTALVPALICAGVTASICFLEWLADQDVVTPFQRIEWITYDWRVRMASQKSQPLATNLGLVAITDDSIQTLLDGTFPYQFGLHWPRQVHARLVNELAAEGASAIGFDVLFAEERPDHAPVTIEGVRLGSDEFFAREIGRADNVMIPAERSLAPADLFRTNAWAVRGHFCRPRGGRHSAARAGVFRRQCLAPAHPSCGPGASLAARLGPVRAGQNFFSNHRRRIVRGKFPRHEFTK